MNDGVYMCGDGGTQWYVPVNTARVSLTIILVSLLYYSTRRVVFCSLICCKCKCVCFLDACPKMFKIHHQHNCPGHLGPHHRCALGLGVGSPPWWQTCHCHIQLLKIDILYLFYLGYIVRIIWYPVISKSWSLIS